MGDGKGEVSESKKMKRHEKVLEYLSKITPTIMLILSVKMLVFPRRRIGLNYSLWEV